MEYPEADHGLVAGLQLIWHVCFVLVLRLVWLL
jgi:hypothetical protein